MSGKACICLEYVGVSLRKIKTDIADLTDFTDVVDFTDLTDLIPLSIICRNIKMKNRVEE